MMMGRSVNGRNGVRKVKEKPKYLTTIPNKLLVEKYDDRENKFSILSNENKEKRLKTNEELISEYKVMQKIKKQKKGKNEVSEIPSVSCKKLIAPKLETLNKKNTEDV